MMTFKHSNLAPSCTAVVGKLMFFSHTNRTVGYSSLPLVCECYAHCKALLVLKEGEKQYISNPFTAC